MKILCCILAARNDVNGAADVSLGVQQRGAAGWTAVSDPLHMCIRLVCLTLFQTCTAFYLCFLFFQILTSRESVKSVSLHKGTFLNREISFRI